MHFAKYVRQSFLSFIPDDLTVVGILKVLDIKKLADIKNRSNLASMFKSMANSPSTDGHSMSWHKLLLNITCQCLC